MMCADYSEVDQKKYVCVCVCEHEKTSVTMLKIGDYEYESCPSFLQLWILKAL